MHHNVTTSADRTRKQDVCRISIPSNLDNRVSLRMKGGDFMKVTTVVSGTALALVGMFAAAAPSFAMTDVVISGNGAKSEQKVEISESSKTIVEQENNSVVTNEVMIMQNSGGNQMNGNTGVSVGKLTTGDNEASVKITNGGSQNVLAEDGCGCPDEDVAVSIKNNGYKSEQKVELKKSSYSKKSMINNTMVFNGVMGGQDSGDNDFKNNTGKKSSLNLKTGSNSFSVTLKNMGNTNMSGLAL